MENRYYLAIDIGGAERYALQRIEHLIVCQTGA